MYCVPVVRPNEKEFGVSLTVRVSVWLSKPTSPAHTPYPKRQHWLRLLHLHGDTQRVVAHCVPQDADKERGCVCVPVLVAGGDANGVAAP